MTAVNVVVLAQSVHVFTDTRASFVGLNAGNLVKCMPLPHMHLAIATRGPQVALDLFARVICERASTFDEALSFLDERGRELPRASWLNSRDAEAWLEPIDLILAGWTRRGPEAAAYFTHEEHGLPAWKIHKIQPILITPRVSSMSFDRLVCSHDRLSEMAAIMQEQAETCPGIVGGYAQETIIDSGGIYTRCLGRMELTRRRDAPASTDVRLPPAFAKHLART